MGYDLKPIQKEVANSIHKDLFVENNNTVLASISTGWGKTILASKMIEHYSKKGLKCLFLANRSELIFQTEDKFLKASSMVADIEKANKFASLKSNVVVASCQTMAKDGRLDRFPVDHFDFIVIDEAHGTGCDQYQIILNHFKSKYLFLTATADKLIDKGLFDIVDKVSYEFTLTESVEAGYNVRPVAKHVNVSFDESTTDDLDDDKIFDKIMPAVNLAILENCKDKKTIIFLSSVERSKKTVEQLKELGLNAIHVDGYMANGERRKALGDFACASIGSVICNASLLGTGYDQPDVDCVVVLRNVSSRALYSQMCGRALRVSPGKKHGLILDFLGLIKKYNITASINEIAMIKKVFIDKMKTGGTVDLIDQDRDFIAEAEKQLALKIILENEKKAHKNLVSADYINKDLSVWTYGLSIPRFNSPNELTENHVKILNAFGVSAQGLKSGNHADTLIIIMKQRQERGLASAKMVRALRKSGDKLAGVYTMQQAKEKIADLKDRWNGSAKWGRK